MARALNELTARGQEFLYGMAQEKAFFTLRELMVEAPVLAYRDASTVHMLDTDVIANGASAVLSQCLKGISK